MPLNKTPIVLVIGATGAQGIPVVRGLVRDSAYKVRALTRDPSSDQAKVLQSLGNVVLFEGTFANEKALRHGFRGCDYAFVNIDGFNAGEKTEIFCGYRPQFRAGHYDGKGRIGEWILQQNKDNQARMKAALFTTGPYIEMTIASSTICTPSIENGVVTWRMPLGNGAVCHVALEDCGHYVRWLLDHQERANCMDLEVSIDHISYHELARAFEEVSGHPAQYIPTSLEDYWTKGMMSRAAGAAAGYNSDVSDPANMTIKQNFSGFWTVWAHSGKSDSKQVIKRDYKLLDEIHPGRVKSAKEWFEREQRRGVAQGLGDLWQRINNMKPVLKLSMDGRKGKI